MPSQEDRADGLRKVRARRRAAPRLSPPPPPPPPPPPALAAHTAASSALKAMEKMVAALDKGHLRSLQKESYLAMARCCDSAPGPAELQHCCHNAERAVRGAEQAVQVAMADFQERLQRCVGRCQDKAQEGLPPAPGERDMARAQEGLAACAADCAVEYERLVPKLQVGAASPLIEPSKKKGNANPKPTNQPSNERTNHPSPQANIAERVKRG
jgi:hypothetical protein